MSNMFHKHHATAVSTSQLISQGIYHDEEAGIIYKKDETRRKGIL
jgi:hypothetical protein